MRLPICLYVVGAPPAQVAATHGDFAAWFEPLFDRAPWRAFDGTSGRLPPLAEHAAVVITGSPASLTAPEPWMEAAIELVRRAHATATPLLGVCFGHQLIGAAFGAGIIANPAGWEVGSHSLEVTAAGRADPLLDGLPARFAVNLCHQDMIDPTTASPAGGLTTLAATEQTAIQVVAAGPVIRGVQFHPEFSAAITRSYLSARHRDIAADADARGIADRHPDRLAEQVIDCSAGALVVTNFLRHWVAGD